MALVDAKYTFIAVDIGGYGRNSDDGICSYSKMGQYLEINKLNIPEDKSTFKLLYGNAQCNCRWWSIPFENIF